MQPPIALRDALARHGLAPEGACWHALPGGRTNRVWRVAGREVLICKLFAGVDGNLLYPNLPAAEYAALKALAAHDIAPRPLALLNTEAGEALIYRHLAGACWSEGTAPVARLLRRLHRIKPDLPLRKLPAGPAALRRSIKAILSACETVPAAFARLPDLPTALPPAKEALLHTDVVPGNIIVTENGLRLIDWQCPAIGDPCEDLASFLSPAMQFLYNRHPLEADQAEAFLAAYDARAVTGRYRQLAPLFHLRIAAYCHWQAERGNRDYRRAMELELAGMGAR